MEFFIRALLISLGKTGNKLLIVIGLSSNKLLHLEQESLKAMQYSELSK